MKVLNDIKLNSDSKNLSVLVLLDLTAAFDTVDHNILLNRLENWVGLSGMVLQWFRSYLTGSEFSVALGDLSLNKNRINCGVPQGYILGPILFNFYMLPLGEIITKQNINFHSYADDTQLYIAVFPHNLSPIKNLVLCLAEINNWMANNCLQLNQDKTEIIITHRDFLAQHFHSLVLHTKD